MSKGKRKGGDKSKEKKEEEKGKYTAEGLPVVEKKVTMEALSNFIAQGNKYIEENVIMMGAENPEIALMIEKLSAGFDKDATSVGQKSIILSMLVYICLRNQLQYNKLNAIQQ